MLHREDDMKQKILKFLDNVLLMLIQKVNIFHLNLANANRLNKTEYQFLTANDEAENIEEYNKALSNALANNKVKNIAISGSYGSGKSSFIKTFEKNNAQYNFLDISLATFKPKDMEGSNQKTTDLSLIEKSILEQMFYKVKNKTIPQSRLKKINRLRWIPIKIISIFSVVLAYFITFKPEQLENILFLKELLQINTIEYVKYLPMFILLIGSYYAIRKILILISNTNIEKLNLQNLELVSNSESASLLNKYLDEILYFFEKTNFDVVVFQDLDRFENLEIFTKLRELNNFINNSEQVDKKIVFIYAVKDEMFKNANERTKFFDFLIPIIPYINATNSKDVLLNYFSNVEKNFIYDISLFISDMRLVKNIYNEYLVYSKKLDNKLDKTKLLAMIIYKNFEPQDFEELHKSKGLVYNIFHTQKKNYLKSHIEKLDNKIADIKDYIEKIEKEPKQDIKELRQLYILKIIEKSNQQFNKTIYTANNSFSIENSTDDSNFELIMEANGLGTYNQQSHYLAVKFSNIEKDLGDYKKREQLILDKINNKRNDFLKQIEDLKKEQERLKDISIKELFEEFLDVTIFEDSNFENKELMKYLLSYGHIDENYEEYISNFFGVSITKDEQDFLRNVKSNGKALKFNYELKNLKEIIDFRLVLNEFNKESIFNIYLVDFLLEHKNSYPKYINKLFHKLSDESEVSKDFILYCLDTCNERVEFVKNIVKYYKNIWIFLSEKRAEKLNTYFGWMIHYADYEDIKKLNYNNFSLNNLAFMQSFSGLESQKVINLIKDLNLKFSQLDWSNNIEIVDFIFKKSHYELNLYMVNKMIFNKCAPRSEVEEDLKTAHLTTIKSDKLIKDKEVLIQYILDNINEYITNIFLIIETNTKESEKTIIELLNNDSLDINLKIKIIDKEETKISHIDSIDNQLWEDLFKLNKIKASWDNVFKYFNNETTNNKFLIDYLNLEENAKEISKIKCGKEYSEQYQFFTQELLKLIIQSNEINIKSYEYLIKNIGWSYSNLDISKLDKEKILLLLEYNRFSFNKECFDALKENTENLHILLIEKNKHKLLKEFEGFEFQADDIIKILEINNSVLSDKTKTDLVEKIDFDLISNKTIAKLIYKYVDKTIIKSIYYTKKMLQVLDSLELKINLIVEQHSELNNDEFLEILEFLPEEYSKIKNLDGKQTVLKNNYYNKKLIDVLKNRKFITSAKDDKKNLIRLYIKDHEKSD